MKSGRAGLVLMLDEAQVLVDDKDRDGQHPLSLLIAAVNAHEYLIRRKSRSMWT